MCMYTLEKSFGFNEFWIEYLEDFFTHIALSWKNLNDNETHIFKIMCNFFYLVPDGSERLLP